MSLGFRVPSLVLLLCRSVSLGLLSKVWTNLVFVSSVSLWHVLLPLLKSGGARVNLSFSSLTCVRNEVWSALFRSHGRDQWWKSHAGRWAATDLRGLRQLRRQVRKLSAGHTGRQGRGLP